MSPKKLNNKNFMGFKKIKSFASKNFNLNKFKINPSSIVEETKNKIDTIYHDFKKQRKKNI